MERQATAESTAAILELRPLPKFTSQADLLAYIDRTRRQLDRFDCLPGSDGKLDPADATRIRSMCDELESDIRTSLAD